MIDLERALELLFAGVAPLGSETVRLVDAPDRVLAEPVFSDRDFPPSDRSAMDGFAVRSGDTESPGTRLRVVGEVRAGQSDEGVHVGSGEAVRIFTGAVVPTGADAVVMVERTEESADRGEVRILDAVQPRQNVRPQAQDLERGGRVLGPGRPIHAAEIAALTSVGRTSVDVYRRPTVGVLSTGDEIVEPDATPLRHQVRNSNAPTLLAQLREHGIEGRYLGISSDERDSLDDSLREGMRQDVLLITGGVSVGEYDLVAEALESAGMETLFHGVAVKPGKPILAGRVGGCLVVGLPGNPLSTFAGFVLFVAPVLRRMVGLERWETSYGVATLTRPIRHRAGRTTLYLAATESTADGTTARVVRSTGSGDVLSMVGANAFVVLGRDEGDLPAGATVSTIPWRDASLRP